MDTILSKNQYMYLYKSSYITIITILYALYQNQYIFAIMDACVLLTSINYWRKPDYSWRRYLDMTIVKIALVYHCIVAYNNTCTMYYIITSIAILCYIISIYYYKINKNWKSTFFHVLLHIIGNIGNIVLYYN